MHLFICNIYLTFKQNVTSFCILFWYISPSISPCWGRQAGAQSWREDGWVRRLWGGWRWPWGGCRGGGGRGRRGRCGAGRRGRGSPALERFLSRHEKEEPFSPKISNEWKNDLGCGQILKVSAGEVSGSEGEVLMEIKFITKCPNSHQMIAISKRSNLWNSLLMGKIKI